jgi:thioredoxin 1
MSLENVTDETFSSEVLASETPVLVDFWAEWCPPCHLLAPVLEQLATEYAGRVRFVKMDADVNPQTILAYGILSMPTLIVFRHGQMLAQHVGAAPKVKLRELLDTALAATPTP